MAPATDFFGLSYKHHSLPWLGVSLSFYGDIPSHTPTQGQRNGSSMNTTGAGLPASAAQPAGASSVPPALVTSSSTPTSMPASTPSTAPATQVTTAAPTNPNVSTTIVPDPNRFNCSFYSLLQRAFWVMTVGSGLGVYGTWSSCQAITSGISGASYMRVIGWDAAVQAFRDTLVNREVRFAGPSTSAQSR
ncbi:hypothetical protein CPB84DRAFT_1848803 [Gymnopilus junonius]|uniref:Uncharacterized protein n=1 Tax=Gymnopilus junonius TaxID=109634 RepID=A0A9P5NLX0_GYMJU|nr:hypothetical protein CPB84DRAFT_1848803 [Gymnopilus junonius]